MTNKQKLLLVSLVILWLLCFVFWYWQNHHGRVGGQISLVKSMWLFTTLSNFLFIPAWLARDKQLSKITRKFAAIFLLGFLLRAIIEMPLLAYTLLWRCWHGITHDLIMLGIAVWWISQCVRTHSSRFFPITLIIVLICEIWNAWMFGKMGNPAEGIYFADDSARFTLINQVTRWEIVVCLSLLCLWLKRYVKGKIR